MQLIELRQIINEVVQELLTEHIINSDKPEEKMKYVDSVLPLVMKSYAYSGGFKGITGEPAIRDELVRLSKDDSLWKMSRRGNKIVAIIISNKTPHGLKRNLIASTGRHQHSDSKPTKGLDDLITFIKDDARLKRTYSEVSGRAETLALKLGSNRIKVEDAKEFLPGKEIVPVDEYHYKRQIRGTWFTKMMIGYPTKYKEKIESILKK